MESLSKKQVEDFHDQGYVIIHGVLCDEEIDRIKSGVMRRIHQGNVIPRSQSYPAPAITFTIDRDNVEDPDLAYIATHPGIIHAAETLLGSPAILSAFVCYLKTPGAKGTSGDYQGSHPTAHQDYKTYQHAGSSLNWLFAITPLGDLDEKIGPLYVSPGSHKLSSIRKMGNGVHHVERAQAEKVAPLVNAYLRKGDLLLMHMFCWHEGGPNQANRDRIGIYNKFRAANAPPACGPNLFNESAAKALTTDNRCLTPHHSDRHVTNTRLLIEHDSKYLMVRHRRGEDACQDSWELPGGNLRPIDLKRPHDAGNVINSLEQNVCEQTGIEVPWMTYIGDYAEGETLCRIYAHPLTGKKPDMKCNTDQRAEWFSADQFKQFAKNRQLVNGYELQVIDQWLDNSYLRGVGESKRRALPGIT